MLQIPLEPISGLLGRRLLRWWEANRARDDGPEATDLQHQTFDNSRGVRSAGGVCEAEIQAVPMICFSASACEITESGRRLSAVGS